MTQKQAEIAQRLFANAAKISFGSVSAELKIHAGRCTGVVYTVSENVRQYENECGRAEAKAVIDNCGGAFIMGERW